MPLPGPHSQPGPDTAVPPSQPGDPSATHAPDVADVLRRLRARGDELDRQTVELVARRAELDAQAEALSRAQAECGALREQALHARAEYERLAKLVSQRESQGLKVLTDRAELIAGREKELERRIVRARDDVVAQRAALQAQRAELAARVEQIEQERAAQVVARRELERLRSEAAIQARELERRLAQLDEREAALGDALAAFADERHEAQRVLAQRQEAAAALAQREHACAAREAELERRVQKARDDLVRQRAEVAATRHAADARAEDVARQARDLDGRIAALRSESATLDERRRTLEQRREELEAQRARLARHDAEVESQRKRLAEARARLDREQARVAQAEAALEPRRQALADEAARLDAARAEVAALREESARRLDDVARAEGALAEERERAARAAEVLAARETELLARANDVELERSRLRDARVALEARRAELESRLVQIEERDAESRQRALAIEVEADQLAHERAVVEFSHEELAGLREAREAEFESVRDALRQRESRVAEAERSAFAAPSLWVVRATGIAAVFALAVGGLWLHFHPVVHRASARIRIATQRTSSEAAVRDHAAALLSPDLAQRWTRDPAGRALWAGAHDTGRLSAFLVPDPPAIDLAVDADTPDAAQRVAGELADRYVAYVNAVPRASLLPAIYRDLVERRDALDAELGRLTRTRTEATTLLALCPPAERRDEVGAEVHRLRDAHLAVIDGLERQRETLARLLAGANIRGTVTDGDVSAALAADEMYRADVAEHASEARLLHGEVSAGMVPLSAQLDAWKAALARLDAVLETQRSQAPPTPIASVLEACSVTVRQHLAAADECRGRWSGLRERVAGLDADREVEALLRLQTEAGDTAEAFAERAAGVVADVVARVDGLRGGADGGTRERVTAAALQSELERMARSLGELRRAAGSATLSENLQLDARDRRVRGIRARLQQRRDLVRDDLQRRADAEAALRREELLAGTRAEIARLERERDQLASRQVDALDALRSLEQAVFERRRLEGDVQRCERDIAALSAQRAQVDAQLSDAERGGPQPDRAALVSLSAAQVSGRHRVRDAALGAGVGFAAMLGLCALMVLKNPLRGRAARRVTSRRAPARAAS